MRFVYYCRYCRAFLGSIEGEKASMERLGLLSLTPEERTDMMEYSAVGETVSVKTICEYCEGALRRHPELLLAQSPLQ